MTPDQLRSVLGSAPESTALLFDFDGTLAPIVADPDGVVAAAGALELLGRLAQRFRTVAVVSGRPRSFLRPIVPDGVDISALYGLESRIAGVDADHPDAEVWRGVVDEVLATCALPPGVVVEPKGYSLTAHFRRVPDAAPAVEAWAEETAAATGLLARAAKASIELHPPVDADKGSAVHALAEGCSAVSYVGDDVGDLPAFDALDGLAAQGVQTVKVVSAGFEVPDSMAASADVVVDGPDDVVALFAPLAPLVPDAASGA
ncbi:MAG: trehalose-phosphatase [Acidimicrobiales bacterium]|nr:trehalose-phosphatase [Acidimicrobiales bacterium]